MGGGKKDKFKVIKERGKKECESALVFNGKKKNKKKKNNT